MAKIPRRFPLFEYLKVEQESVAKVKLVMERAAKDIEKDILALEGKTGVGANVSRLQLEAQRASIKAHLGRDLTQVGNITANGQQAAAKKASEVISTYEETLTGMVADQKTLDLIRKSEALRAASNLETVMARQQSSYIPLKKQVYKTGKVVNGQVDNLVNSALARGLTWKEFAKEAKSFVSPATPGGASYAANRLARTEINNAFHSSSLQRFQDSGLATGVDWNLSSSHPEGDECDTIAAESPYGFKNVPKKPHPFCLCFVTPALPDEDTFFNNLMNGDYDDEPFAKEIKPEEMDPLALTKLISARQRGMVDWADEWKKKNPTGNLLLEREYLDRRAELNMLWAVNNANTKAAGLAIRLAKVKVHPKVDKLPTMTPPANMKAAYAGGKANPNGRGFSRQDLRDYQINCTRVAYTTEMRMRGYDIQAGPAGTTANKSDLWIQQNWVDPETGTQRKLKKVNTMTALEKGMLKEPDGARYFVVAPWKQGGAHIWNAEKVNGKIVWHEGQVAKDVTTEAAKKERLARMDFDTFKGGPSQVRFMRVDDLEPTDAAVTRGWIEVNGKIVKK